MDLCSCRRTRCPSFWSARMHSRNRFWCRRWTHTPEYAALPSLWSLGYCTGSSGPTSAWSRKSVASRNRCLATRRWTIQSNNPARRCSLDLCRPKRPLPTWARRSRGKQRILWYRANCGWMWRSRGFELALRLSRDCWFLPAPIYCCRP